MKSVFSTNVQWKYFFIRVINACSVIMFIIKTNYVETAQIVAHPILEL